MKRWKTIGTVVFIISMFTLYYVQQMKEVDTYPSFTLHMNEGDSEVVKPVKLYGDYIQEENTRLFSLDLEQTMYIERMPYLERLNGFHHSAEIDRLQQDHPSYMRGKEDDRSVYTENDGYIVQSRMKWGTYKGNVLEGDAFELSVLHKELDKQARFTIPIPEEDQASFGELEKMYAVGEELHLVTTHHRENKSGEHVLELRVYTVQLERGKISHVDVIYTKEQEDRAEETMFTPIRNPHSIMSEQRMLLLQAVAAEPVDIEEALRLETYEDVNVDYKMLAYDFRTKGFETYSIPSAITDGAEIISYEDNHHVYLTEMIDDKLHITEWSLGNEEPVESIAVPTDGSPETYETANIEDHIYVYVEDQKRDTTIGEIHVLHVPTGEWVYAGEVQTDRPLKEDEDVTIHGIE